MLRKTNQSKWAKYIVETLTLSFVFGILGGVVFGIVNGWNYLLRGLFLPLIDAVNLSMNNSLIVAFLLLFLFLLVFLAVRRVIRNTALACFVAGALACLPFFLLWGYEINQMNGIWWSNFFERGTIAFNLKIGIGFITLWLAVSIILLFWTRRRILEAQPLRLGFLSLLLGVALAFNIGMYLFYNFHTVKRNSPNVLIILIDCLGAEHLSSYGYNRNTTPNIDEFAKDSVAFTQAISQSTFTKTSVASLFTSLYPYQHGVYRGAGDSVDPTGGVTTDVLSREEVTLAEVLSESGFFTTAWVQQVQVASYMGFAQGFVDYHEWQGDIESINEKFMDWAGRVGKKREFFAYLHYIDLHSPWDPEPPYDTLYVNEIARDGEKPKANEISKALYDGLITYIDAEIGALLNNLKKEGLYDNTLIILTADHGDSFRKHNSGHGKAPYEEVIRVPLIIKFPDSLHAGTVVGNQVRLIDVMPTVLDFLDIKIDKDLSGFSLMSYLDGDSHANHHEVDFPKYAVSEIYNKGRGIDALSIRTEEFKYIHFPNKGDQLYDLKDDPRESNNVIESKPEVAREFRQMLYPILSEKNQKRVDTVNLDEKAIQELKSLGYIQ